MFAAFLEGVLPGTRSLRPPLTAGLLWSLFLWLLVSDGIPDQGDAQGWIRQVYALAEAAGPTMTIVVVTILILILGATAHSALEWLTTALGRLAVSVQVQVSWQRHAHDKKENFRRSLAELEQQLSGLTEPEKELTEQQVKQRQNLEQRVRQVRDRLSSLDKNTWLRIVIRRTQDARKILGNPPAATDTQIEHETVVKLRRQELDKALQERDIPATVEGVEAAVSTQAYDLTDGQIADRLGKEFGDDPLDALRALDKALFLELDRERSEREVRLAASAPIIAIGVQAGVRWNYWWLLLAAVGLLSLIINSLGQTTERARVLNLVTLRGLMTPALREADIRGRDAVRAYIAQMKTEVDK